MRSKTGWVVLGAAAMFACGGVNTGGTGGGGGGSTGGGGDGGDGGTGGGGQGVVTFTLPGSACSAAPLLQYGQMGSGVIDTAGKQYLWRVQVQKGDFLQFATVANPNDEGGKLDTTLTVFDASGDNVLATIDDGYPRHGTDAWLYYRAAVSQQLCVRVEDYSTWDHAAALAFPNDPFTFFVTPVAGSADGGLAFDTEPNGDAGTAQPCEMKQYPSMPGGTVMLYGGLDTASDVDVYRITPGINVTQLSFMFPPLGDTPKVGVSTLGSTLLRTSATLTTLDGTVLGALAPPLTAPDHMSPSMDVSVPAGTQDFLLWILRPAGDAAGANDFYASTLTASVDDPLEAETQPGQNDTVATAEPLRMALANAKLHTGFVLGHLSTPTDIDVFSFAANTGDTVAIRCRAQRAGSGLRGATFVISSAMATMQGETESEMADVSWTGAFGSMQPVPVPQPGTYYLKVHTVSQDTVNTGTYYRCALYVQSP
jgi:hypothetical protein